MNTDEQILVTAAEDPAPFSASRGYGTIGANDGPIESPVVNNTIRNQLPQYEAVLSATLTAMSAGTVLAWTSPISNILEKGEFHNIEMSQSQLGWIGSLVPLGALCTCIPTGFICDKIGRKNTLLSLLIPYSLGWSLIVWSNNLTMLCFGRLICGIAVGACCVAAPLYVSEVAQKEIRGRLGSYFQLMVVTGILYAYTLGKYMDPTRYSVMCLLIPVIFFVTFIYQPESPVYYLKKSRYEDARISLVRLRRSEDVADELVRMEASVKETAQTHSSLRTLFARKAYRKAVIISMSLMFFQQFSGINAIIFYTGTIFNLSGFHFDARSATILVGFFQVVATFISSIVIEKLGRKILLITSDFVMALSTLVLGFYFSLKDHKIVDDDTIAAIGFIPIIALCVYIIVFSLGFGPIPWMISGEIFTPEVKSVTSSVAGALNWLLAFFITKLYLEAQADVGADVVFYFFTVISLCGTAFVYFVVPETKGKTVEEVQLLLEA